MLKALTQYYLRIINELLSIILRLLLVTLGHKNLHIVRNTNLFYSYYIFLYFINFRLEIIYCNKFLLIYSI